ncbi:hypothetical protein HHK36_014904 [Tetracentron sinense]|uniref:Sulfhydryl oxidase n=1 Tax=Tetracentron sinense TaxID=13715 RepID=A0A834Z681_TETSI|nr:hypothetical protein HHK36_014904 [Tetracentron sinense]
MSLLQLYHSMSTVHLLLLLPFLSLEASSVHVGHRSILRSIDDPNRPDAAVDLNSTNFDLVLRDSPAPYAIVEFFAHCSPRSISNSSKGSMECDAVLLILFAIMLESLSILIPPNGGVASPLIAIVQPHYERVARLFNGPDAVHPGIIFMARVDCALKNSNVDCSSFELAEKFPSSLFKLVRCYKSLSFSYVAAQMNTKLCNRFSVSYYPLLLWGHPSKFASGGWESKQEKNDIHAIDDGRTADRLINWINKQIGSSYNLDDVKYENGYLLLNASDPGQIVRAAYDVEEATSNAFDIILEHKLINLETRASLLRFLQLLVVHHPSRRCRKGTAEILVDFDDSWPSAMWSANTQEAVISHGNGALRNFQICGKEIFCRGSKNDTRGFSCGLWVLLHSLSVRIEDGESHLAFTAICDFIHNFFICEECRQHFNQMCSGVSTPFNKTRDFALWLWRTHNEVNERLMKEEASLRTGDPKFPKIIWPSKQLCPSCSLSRSRENNGTSRIDWDIDEVFKFLVGYYGKMLVSSYKNKGLLGDGRNDRSLVDDAVTSTNAVAVPVGAALAIALASFAFGALAWFWRSQQKNRKYLHQLHSF